VRELQNIIERGIVLATGRVLTLERSLLPVATEATTPPANVAPAPAAKADATSLDNIARQHILRVLEQTHWVIEGTKGAAQILNLHPNTLRSRMKKLRIQRPR
jgi:transcriptional regulator with GAF, ATPase, and Fis domain